MWATPPPPNAPYDVYSPKELAVHAVLRSWFDALEDGSAHSRYPDMKYQRFGGKPLWTDEELEILVATIDTYVWKQQDWAERTHFAKYDAGPGFDRLAPIQRLSFAQDLERALHSHDDDGPTPAIAAALNADASDPLIFTSC